MATRILFSNAGITQGEFKRTGEVFRKDFIRVGKWTIAKHGQPTAVLPVDEARMDKWEKHFRLFRERGISVPLTVDHIQVTDAKGKSVLRKLTPGMAEAKRGDVRNLFREGTVGMFDVTPSDADAELLMGRCPEVSLELEKDFIDGHGNYYDEAITAITLTPIPVVPGQKMEWERVEYSDPLKIAASRDPRDGNREVICLSAEPLLNRNPPTSENRMSPTLMSRARAALKMPDAPEEEVHAKAVDHIESCSRGGYMSRAAADAEIVTKTKALDDKIVTLSRDLESAKAGTRVVTIEDMAKAVDEDAMEMASNAFKTRINALGAKATPKQKELLSRLADVKEPKNVICMSKKSARAVGLDKALLDQVLDIFEAGDIGEMTKLLTEQSKTQNMHLSRDPASGTAEAAAAAAEAAALTARMIQSGNAGAVGSAPQFVM